MQTVAKGNLTKWYGDYLYNIKSEIKHGLLSASTIIDYFGNIQPIEEEVENAAFAMSIHDIAKPGKNDEHPMPIISFYEYPFVSLLIICDQLQVWDRQTGMENIYEGLSLDFTEVTSFDYDENEKRLSGIINYYPFRNILPLETRMTQIYNGLLEILHTDVIPILKKIDFSSEPFDIQFDFLLNGRENIAGWSDEK